METKLAKICEAAFEILKPLERWSKQCHAASLELVLNGVANRVARGWCEGISGQHSWAVVGRDCYDEQGLIVDATAWSYCNHLKPEVLVRKLGCDRYFPHGIGNIWEWGRPPEATKPAIELEPNFELSDSARGFLETLGPLDLNGWILLASQAPVKGWPAGEIFAAMDDTSKLKALVPVDKLGMLTERNPGSIYLA